MKKKNSQAGKEPMNNNRQQGKGNEQENAENRSAFEDAMHDIDADPELSAHSPNDDLDEEESARLGDDRTNLV